jgi:hypothetical protein
VEPFIALLSCTPNPATPKRLQEAMFQPLITGLLPQLESEQPAKKKRRTEEGAETGENRFPNLAVHGSLAAGQTAIASEKDLANSVLSRR